MLRPMGTLTYVSDHSPGITRKISGGGFRYFDADGHSLKDRAVIKRIKALVIPPAYTDVWICPDPLGHIQATGRDARGRKQYRYHAQWTLVRDATKYEQLADFACALPRIRRRVARDMKNSLLTHDKILAVLVFLLESTLIRIGAREYARANKSYGLTTLHRRHIAIEGGCMRFRFRGKGGVHHDVTVNDRRVSTVIKRCMEIPGHELFQYIDPNGTVRGVDSGNVNAYIKDSGRGDFTAKHYRTWAASVFALSQLQCNKRSEGTPAQAAVNEVIKKTARLLGNTPAVCRDCYIHPDIIKMYLNDELPPRKPIRGPRGLNADERRFLDFLRRVNPA